MWGTRQDWIDTSFLKPELPTLVGIGMILFANYVVTVPVGTIVVRMLRVVPNHRRLFDAFCYASAIFILAPQWFGMLDRVLSHAAPPRNGSLALLGYVIVPLGIPYFAYLSGAMAVSQGVRQRSFAFLLLLFSVLALGSLSAALIGISYAIQAKLPDGSWSGVPTFSSLAVRWQTVALSTRELPLDSVRWDPIQFVKPGDTVYVRIVYSANNGPLNDVHASLSTLNESSRVLNLIGMVSARDASPRGLVGCALLVSQGQQQIAYNVEAVTRFPNGVASTVNADDVVELAEKPGMSLGSLNNNEWGVIIAKLSIVEHSIIVPVQHELAAPSK